MSSLIGNLLSNANALNVHSLGVQTAGQNISNVNDPSYARQRVVLRDGGNYQAGTRVQSRGIEALGIEHIRNNVLDEQILREAMNTSSYQAQYDLLEQLQVSVNDIIDRNDSIDTLDGNDNENLDSHGIGTAIDDFLNAFSELASTPDSEAIKETLFERMQIVVDEFNLAAERLSELDVFIANQIEDEVQEVNILLDEIAELNSKIARFEAQEGIMAPDLRDQRQESLEELAKYIDFETLTSGVNPAMIDVRVRNAANPLATTETYSTLISGGSVNGEIVYQEFDEDDLAVNQMLFRPLDSDEDIKLNLNGGSIDGAIQVKDVNLVQLQSDFDTLASSLVASVNSAYQGDPAGVYYNAANELFNPDPTGTGAAITAANIALSDTLVSTEVINGETYSYYDVEKLVTSNNPLGGNELANAIGELVDTKTIGVIAGEEDSGMTFRQYIAQFSARVGAEVDSASGALDNQQTVEAFLTTQRESYSGVNIDEEMTDLLRFQRAFQGTSRVISTLDQMLQQVVAGLIR